MLHNFTADGFESLYPRYAGGRPPTFTLAERREIKKIAKSRPAGHGLPFSRWSLAKLADFLVAEGVVEDISHEGLRELLRAENVSFQAVKTWKVSADPDYAAKKARVDYLYAIAGGEAAAGPGAPDVVFCLDEFGPLNLQPRPGRAWARRGRPTTAPAGCGTCSPRWSWAPTRCTGTSRNASGAASSSSSAATCAACTRRPCGSRSSATTTART